MNKQEYLDTKLAETAIRVYDIWKFAKDLDPYLSPLKEIDIVIVAQKYIEQFRDDIPEYNQIYNLLTLQVEESKKLK